MNQGTEGNPTNAEHRTAEYRNRTGQFDIPMPTHFFLSLCGAEPLVGGRTVFLPFTHGPRGFVLSWSTIEAFSAASRGVSVKRLTGCAISLLHSSVSVLVHNNEPERPNKTTQEIKKAVSARTNLLRNTLSAHHKFLFSHAWTTMSNIADSLQKNNWGCIHNQPP